MIFASAWRYNSNPEPGGGIRITEQAGYRDAKTQIEQMMIAGERLQAFRREYFDLPEGVGDADIDPMRKPGIDLAEASQVGRELARRMKEKDTRKKAAQAAKLAAEAADRAEPVQNAGESKKGPEKALKAAD